ncbi:MAG: hypothetical protein U9N87_08870 [Planctomycetota bacterium]|nr:hypothetical protein [Planctomycetota bacterium]
MRFGLMLVVGLLVLAQAMAADKPPKRRSGTFADSGGFYAAGSDGSVGTLNTFRASVDGDINTRLRDAKSKGLINIVQLGEGSRFRGDLQKAKKSLGGWLRRTDLSLVDAVHLCEEHPGSARANLDALYDHIKAFDPTLPVYVWPSYPLGPFGKSDGWAYDAYGADYTDYRKIVFNFLRTGKPFVACVDGSGYSDIRSAREQLMVCHELDIPVFYFVADSGSGSVNGWKGIQRASLIPWRHFVYTGIEFQSRCKEDTFAGSDMVWGEPIELAADAGGKIEQSWRGLGPSTVYGFTRLGIDGEKFWAKDGSRVAIDLPFWSVLPVEKAELTLLVDRDPGSDVVVKRSRCGQTEGWHVLKGTYSDGEITYPLGDKLGQEFRVRVEFVGKIVGQKTPLVVSGYFIAGNVAVPKDRAINLDFFFDAWRGKIKFSQDLAAGLWRTLGRIENPDALEPTGPPALRGRKGSGTGSTIIEKLTSQKPLKDIVVRLTGHENRRNLGGSFSLGVSLDGKTILKKISPDPKGKNAAQTRADGSFRGTVTLDLANVSEFDGCRTFFVHLQQRNGSGVRGNVSSSLERLEVDAEF